jgi:hypothetical protein
MMFFGFAEVLMLAIMTGGTSSTDLIALVQPKHYFQYREWEPSIEKMVDLAFEEPKDAKTQIAQLTALRWLADESEALKKSPKYADQRKMIEAIAQGKKAQDPEGFAKDYANRVLMKLDNAKPAAMKPQPFRDDSLAWFPADATLAGAVDLVQARQATGDADAIKQLLKFMQDREKKMMYGFIEKSGNIRLDRLSFAYTDAGRDKSKFYVRATGKGNQEWIVDMIKAMDNRNELGFKTTKDDKGIAITQIQEGNNRPPVVMLVGNTDMLLVGYANNAGKQEELVDEVLAARSKKKANVTVGALKDRLGKIPDKAISFLVGGVPEEMKQGLAFTFNPVPSNITAHVERAQQGLDVHVETTSANADDGGKLVKKIADLRKDGIKGLQDEMQQPQRAGQPPIPFQALINLMESLQVQGKDDKVQVQVFVPDGLIRELTNGWMMRGAGRDFPPPEKCGK